MTNTLSVSPTSLLRQFRLGLHQQMFYLGRDVIHASGNQLIDQGFVKLPSPLLKGTSCYHKTQADGSRIELHGASIAWIPAVPPGIIFIRGPRRMRLWTSNNPFIPGDESSPHLIKATPQRLHHLSKHIAQWWLDYEQAIRSRFGLDYRIECHKQFQSVPKAKAWKSPNEDLTWLAAYANEPRQRVESSRPRRSFEPRSAN